MAQISVAPVPTLVPAVTITPVRKRRTRPSFSPVETPKISVPKRSISATREQPETSQPMPAPSTAALEFPEFSFIGSDGDISSSNVSAEHKKALSEYLIKEYDAVDIQYQEPFILVQCEDKMPPEEERPFSIAGLIAIWMLAEDSFYFHPLVGDPGLGDAVQVDSSIVEQLDSKKMPPDDVILYLADHIFPDCEAISLLWDTLVMELPKTGVDDFIKRLKSLPERIEGFPYFLRYFNGPLPNTPRRSREVKPNPVRRDNLVADETDYVQVDGKFYPGSVISSIETDGSIHSSISAGVLIERGQERRLTCSWHNWAKLAEDNLGMFGQTDAKAQRVFRLAQGLIRHGDGAKAGDDEDAEPGTAVGFVRERIGETDIAFAQLDDGIIFENKFMEMDALARTFVPSEDQHRGDRYQFDSYVTGLQTLYGFGKRAALARRRRYTGHPQLSAPEGGCNRLPSDNEAYIVLDQGIYASNAPIADRMPQIRDSVRGTVLVRCGSVFQPKKSESEVLRRGEICGMMVYADLQPKFPGARGNITSYLIYADTFDPVIEDGWTIVPVDEPQEDSREAEESEQEDETELEDTPSKKRRTA